MRGAWLSTTRGDRGAVCPSSAPSPLSAPTPALSLSPKDERSISEPSRDGSAGERRWMDGWSLDRGYCALGGLRVGHASFFQVAVFLELITRCVWKNRTVLPFIRLRFTTGGRITRLETPPPSPDVARHTPLIGSTVHITAANGQIVPTLQF